MIEKKCENCVYFNNSICSAFLNEKWCNLKFFKASEQAIRKDEMKRVLNIVDGVIDSNIHTCNHYVEIMQEIEKELTEE